MPGNAQPAEGAQFRTHGRAPGKMSVDGGRSSNGPFDGDNTTTPPRTGLLSNSMPAPAMTSGTIDVTLASVSAPFDGSLPQRPSDRAPYELAANQKVQSSKPVCGAKFLPLGSLGCRTQREQSRRGSNPPPGLNLLPKPPDLAGDRSFPAPMDRPPSAGRARR